jgi:SMI1 / KNR4 family (SUKH-1)
VLFFTDEALESAKPHLAKAGYDVRWSRNSGATEADLEACEKQLALTLSDELRAFLATSNGATLEQHHKDEVDPAQGTYLYFLNCEQIVERTLDIRDLADDVGAAGVEQFACIVDYLDGNYVLLDTRTKTGLIVDGYHEEMSLWSSAFPIAQSFAEFAEKVVAALHAGSGMLYWIPGGGTP